MTNILSKFPKHLKPRDVQRDALLALEKNVDSAEVFVVNLPVSAGKSAIAMALAAYFKKASIITPTKLLVDQYKDEYPYIHVLRAKSDYFCDTFGGPLTKRPQSKKLGKLCSKDMGCRGCNSYRSDLRKARVMPYLLSNYYIYLSHKLYRDTLLADEAHKLVDVLKTMASKKIWRAQHLFPANLRTREHIKNWVNQLSPAKLVSPQLKFLKEEINSYRPKYLISVGEEPYRDTSDLCIKMVPLDLTDSPPIMWPSSVKRIVLLSGTISRKDIEQMGLAGRRIQYIEASSPIAAERRPVIVPKESRSMAYRFQDQNIESFRKYIEEMAYHNTEKGLIHVTYGLAEKLKNLNWSSHLRDRLIFHTKTNKTQQYQAFRNAPADSGKILIASGMYEGIDLPYDAGRWQVLAKIPWPSLADPAIKYLCSQDNEWYLWEALKTTMQAVGRICRTPEDRGVTIIYDSTFKRLYKDGVTAGLIPKWFQDSVKFY